MKWRLEAIFSQRLIKYSFYFQIHFEVFDEKLVIKLSVLSVPLLNLVCMSRGLGCG